MKSLVLLSGGLDSCTCLAKMIAENGVENVEAVAFDYGQKHRLELFNAQTIALHYGVKLTVLKIDASVFSRSASTLLQGNGEMSHGKSYAEILAEGGQVDTYVPFRNGLMLSQAAALAYSIGFDSVVYGAHADDAAGGAYPDCTPEFYEAMDNSIQLGTGGKIRLLAPLVELNKGEVVKLGLSLDAPYHLTRSCYEEDIQSCGDCATCIDRLKAFDYNGALDPIEYKRGG